jgi:hypothetical protein
MHVYIYIYIVTHTYHLGFISLKFNMFSLANLLNSSSFSAYKYVKIRKFIHYINIEIHVYSFIPYTNIWNYVYLFIHHITI